MYMFVQPVDVTTAKYFIEELRPHKLDPRTINMKSLTSSVHRLYQVQHTMELVLYSSATGTMELR